MLLITCPSIAIVTQIQLLLKLPDIRIFASLDPVDLDQACYDAVVNHPSEGKKVLCERMEKQHAIHIVEEAVR